MRSQRGFTLVETLLALALVLPFGFALVAIIGTGLRGAYTAAALAGDANALRTLVERWDAEAHGAAAIFAPATDLFGQPACDSAGLCRELDFFTRDSRGAARFWAYRFDAPAHTLTRYRYDDLGSSGPVNPRPSGISIANIAAFTVQRIPISRIAIPALGDYIPQDVAVPFGYPGVVGGNAIVAVDVRNTAFHLRHELAPRLAATGFNIFVGTYVPPAPLVRPSPQPGQTRYYGLFSFYRIGLCVFADRATSQCDPDRSILPRETSVEFDILGTVIAPFASRISLSDVCQTSAGTNRDASALSAVSDATGRLYAQVIDMKLGISELWLVAAAGSSFVPAVRPVRVPSGGDPNPFVLPNSSRPARIAAYLIAC